MKTDFVAAINQVSSEKGISKEVVVEAIEAALVSAYKRNFSGAADQDVVVRLNRQTGDVRVFVVKRVVEEVTDPLIEISLAEARGIEPTAALEGTVEVETTPRDFGRVAALTAKQVVLQRLREAERELVYEAFTDREGDVVTGVIQRVEPKAAIFDLGKAEAALPTTEQVPGEAYRPGQRLKVYVVEVSRTPRGPQIVVSRAHRGLVRRMFELEVPEVYSGAVEIKSIAREAGSRSKVAVVARQEGVDPVGSCVGVRGVRIQNIVNELNGEKIDVVQWSPDTAVFVANALSPAPVLSVNLNEADKTAVVVVPERQLSLAIGREGQNARLAAKLTGWRIDIKAASVTRPEGTVPTLTREESLARLTGGLEERPE
ncbi:MAG TPA: transcription termination factor NusA [Chloroflexota bacterium]|nr:transcription termination factor NusA [Chloroflexota bacterium]